MKIGQAVGRINYLVPQENRLTYRNFAGAEGTSKSRETRRSWRVRYEQAEGRSPKLFPVQGRPD